MYVLSSEVAGPWLRSPAAKGLFRVWHHAPVITEEWNKSSYSNNNGACVEVRRDGASVQVRDTKDREGGTLTFTAPEWLAFVAGAKSGDFDL